MARGHNRGSPAATQSRPFDTDDNEPPVQQFARPVRQERIPSVRHETPKPR